VKYLAHAVLISYIVHFPEKAEQENPLADFPLAPANEALRPEKILFEDDIAK
jgi:hypothetical protein